VSDVFCAGIPTLAFSERPSCTRALVPVSSLLVVLPVPLPEPLRSFPSLLEENLCSGRFVGVHVDSVFFFFQSACSPVCQSFLHHLCFLLQAFSQSRSCNLLVQFGFTLGRPVSSALPPFLQRVHVNERRLIPIFRVPALFSCLIKTTEGICSLS